MMVYAPNGDLFVSSPSTNSIFVLRDANNDGVFEARGVFADGTTAPRHRRRRPRRQTAASRHRFWVFSKARSRSSPTRLRALRRRTTQRRGPGGLRLPFGLAFHGGYLYVGNTDSIVRFEYRSGDLEARGAPEKLLDLPTGGHSTRNIVFNRAGTKLYIAVGSASNSDAGEDCRRAAILEANPDGTGARVFASGIRNPVGLTLQPGTDMVWVATNERDNLGDDLVPDYATSVKDGGFYGWPYSYIGRHYDPKYVGAFPDLVGRAIVPDVLLPAHSAALGITFYTGSQFPAEIPQRRVRGAARVVEPDGRVRIPGRVLPDGERQARTDRRLPDRLPGQHRRERHTRSAVGTSGGRDRRSRRRAARLRRQRQSDLARVHEPRGRPGGLHQEPLNTSPPRLLAGFATDGQWAASDVAGEQARGSRNLLRRQLWEVFVAFLQLDAIGVQ